MNAEDIKRLRAQHGMSVFEVNDLIISNNMKEMLNEARNQMIIEPDIARDDVINTLMTICETLIEHVTFTDKLRRQKL